ncbi:MAG: PilC/PilY family type IV pilus protein [Pedobacter sp.]|nr:PilC/PilY family type IV pilus protein [Pedobacter sp.]
MRSFKKTSYAMLAFFYMFSATSPVYADDSEIYMGGTSSAAGNPNVLMLIDTSGSMKWNMTNDKTASDTNNARYTHLKKAVEKILSTLPGNIRVGLARYNEDAQGGRIIYPLTILDAPAGSNSDGSQSRSFQIKNPATDDVQQTGAAGSTMVTNGTTLTVGGIDTSVVMTAASDGSVQCNTATAPLPYVGSASSIKGLYIGNHPTKVGTTFCQSNLGLRFTNIPIPPGATIGSAKLILTHAGETTAAPSGWTGTTDSDVPLSFKVAIQNTGSTTAAKTFSATAGSADLVNGSGRAYETTKVNASLANEEFTSDGDIMSIDVTSLVQTRVSATSTWDATDATKRALVFRVEGNSGDGGVVTTVQCTKTNWFGQCTQTSTITTDAPKIRRIYGFHDTPAYAPKLVLSYIAAGTSNTVGVRFSGVDIPKNATINSAYLQVTAAVDSSTQGPAASFALATDALDATYSNSLPLNTTNHLYSSRWGSEGTTINPSAWTKDQSYQLDVKQLLQSHVNYSGYCGSTDVTGNNAVGFRVRALDNTGARTIYSYDGDPAKAPRLVVNYTAPTSGSCVQLRRSYSVSGSANDASQTGTNNNVLNEEKVTLGSSNRVGMRFEGFAIPQGAEIVEAVLTLTPANSTASALTVKAMDTNDQAVFVNNASKLSNMALTTASATWTPASWSSGVASNSVNLKSVVQAVVNRSGWVSGGALGLMLTGGGSQIYMADTTSASRRPTLVVIYKSTNANDGISTARQVLIDTVNGLDFPSNTPLNESYYETALYMMGQSALYGRAYDPTVGSYLKYPNSAPAMNSANLYQSPVGEASCQSSNIIVLTDGAPTADDDNPSLGAGTCNSPFACMKKTARYLAETGRNGFGIKTYTIGFGPVADKNNSSFSQTAYDGLDETAAAGQGEFFFATDGDALAASFQAIFARISDSNGTMAAPGVAVSQLNRSQHLDQLYFGVFKPKTQKRWPGNLKRYRYDDNTGKIVSYITGSNAIDDGEQGTKYFAPTARSWWDATLVDGNEATEGGAANQQKQALKVYTDSGSAGALSLLNPLSPPTAMGTGTVASDNVKWIMGYDVDSENGQGPTGFRQAMGAPIHPQPTLVSYGSSDESFVVFVSTNDGLLHSINNADGSHNWAYLPSALQGNIGTLRDNPSMSPGEAPIYGLDGSWTPVTLQSGTRLLVGGMRQGGTNYYAVELPASPSGAPSLKWMLTGAQLSGGNTWAQPVFARIRDASHNVKEVFILGGGMDNDLYEAGSSTISAGADKGAAVYIVGASDGAILAKIATANMKYSVPGAPRVVDKDGDTLADHIYFGDMGGQLFRVDIDNAKSAPKIVKGVSLLAQLGVSDGSTGKVNDRRFYETPAVAFVKGLDKNGVNNIYAAVAIGSGDRNFPKSNKDTQDRMYVIKDFEAGKIDAVTTSPASKHVNLSDLTSSATTDNTKAGWYINIPRTGEKVLSSPFIFSRQVTDSSTGKTSLVYEVYFNSFRPDVVSASCSPVVGSTSAWIVNLFDASARKVTNANGTVTESRYVDSVVNGISGSDVGLIRGDELKRITGTKTDTAGKLPPGLGVYKRTRWFDNPNAN